MARFQVTGINDHRDFCECCGKSGLKRVVWIHDTETGEEKHFGTSCAMRPAKGFDCSDEIKTAIKRHDQKQKRAISLAFTAYRATGAGFINGFDAKGSPTATVANPELWAELLAAQMARLA